MFDDQQLIEALTRALWVTAGALISVIIWGVKVMLRRFDRLERVFWKRNASVERRLTVLETLAGVNPPSDGEDE